MELPGQHVLRDGHAARLLPMGPLAQGAHAAGGSGRDGDSLRGAGTVPGQVPPPVADAGVRLRE